MSDFIRTKEIDIDYSTDILHYACKFHSNSNHQLCQKSWEKE